MGVYNFRSLVRGKGDDSLPMNARIVSRHRIELVAVFFLIISLFLIAIPRQTTAKFVMASWSYPDENGEGIFLFQFYENSTGSWLIVSDTNLTYDGSPNEVEWNASIGLRLRCWTHFNYTFHSVGSVELGKNYQRHNITVTLQGETVFSQANFTFNSGISGPPNIYAYSYDVVLEIIPSAGSIYVVYVTYETYQLEV